MKYSPLTLLSILLPLAFFSCKPDKDDPELVSGTGGQLTLVAKPQHHGSAILNKANYPDSAFIKFNTQNFPGTDPAGYDLILAGETAGEDHVHIENLKPGKMYIYMAGWDSTINARVTGGIPVNTTQTSGELVVVVPVTE